MIKYIFHKFVFNFLDAELRTLCQEVVDLMKSTVGVERFTVLYAKAQKALGERKDTRKRQRAMEVSLDP